MPVSDAVFVAWLKADNTHRTLLVEASPYSGGSVVTRYMSNQDYVTLPTDTPANQSYDSLIVGELDFTTALSTVFTGEASSSWGDLKIDNSAGAQDSWLNDAWDGRAVTLLLGDVSWIRSDFRTILTGVSADIVNTDSTTLSLRLRDKSWMLDVPIQTNLIGGTTANANAPIPLCYGQCFNVSPVLTNSATYEYQVHDGAINDITDVRDNGVSVAYTKDLTHGKFTLTSAPAGQITADVQGDKVSGTYYTKAADIAQQIITTRTLLTSGDLDASAFTALDTTCPQKLGLYISGSTPNVVDMIDQIFSSVGAWWTFSQAGLLTIGRFDAPTGTPVLSLDTDDTARQGLRLKTRILPYLSYSLGYKRNWTPQASSFAGSVSAANIAAYTTEYLTVTQANSGISTVYKLAVANPMVPSLLVDPTEAQTECTRRATLWSVLRYIYELDSFAAPLSLQLGQEISVTNTRYGFSAGKDGIVTAMQWSPTKNAAMIQELFV